MQQSGIGVTLDDRRQIVSMLNNILKQFYATQPEFLLKRAKQYEAMCFRRAENKPSYYARVNEGVGKIAKTFHKTVQQITEEAVAKAKLEQQVAVPLPNQSNAPGPVTPALATAPLAAPPATSSASAVPVHQPGNTDLKEFFLSLGLIPVPGLAQPPDIPSSSLAALPNVSCAQPTESSARPIELPGVPNASTYVEPTSIAYQHISSADVAQAPAASRALSTTTLATDLPPANQSTSGNQVVSPPKESTSSTQPKSQKNPRTPRAKTSTERSRLQRARKRNSTKASLQTPPLQKPPAVRQMDSKSETVNKENVSGAMQASRNVQTVPTAFQQSNPSALHHHQISASPHVNIKPRPASQSVPQPLNSQNASPQDHVSIADGINVSIAQVYIAAASIGIRLSVDMIRRLSREQVISLFVRARQSALSNASNAVTNAYGPVNPTSSHADPLGLHFQATQIPRSVPVAQAGVVASEVPPAPQVAAKQFDEGPVLQANVPGTSTSNMPICSDIAQRVIAANPSISGQEIQSQNAHFYGISPQEILTLHVPQPTSTSAAQTAQHVSAKTNAVANVAEYARMQQLHASVAGQRPLWNATSDAFENHGGEPISRGHIGNPIHASNTGANAIPAIGSSQMPESLDPAFNLTRQIGTDGAPSTSLAPSSLHLVIIRLQRFQQKYRVYLKLVRDNLAAMMAKGIQGFEGQRYYRYMRYAVKLLTCPASTATRLSMEIIDKVESFLREYLVRYQGISLKRAANPNPGNAVPGSSSGTGVGSNNDSNLQVQLPPGSSQAPIPQSSQLEVQSSVLAQQNMATGPETGHVANPNVASALPTPPSQNVNIDYQGTDQEVRNAAIRAIEAQRGAVAAAGIRQAQVAANTRILGGQFQSKQVLLPEAALNVQPDPQSAPETSPITSSVEKTTSLDVQSEIAKRVSRVNHYVRMAVHWTDGLAKNLEHEPLLRVREERIAEVCLVMESEKDKDAKERPSGMETKSSAEPSLMDIVKKECEDTRKKHTKLIIQIGEEWKRPVVSCLLAFKSVRLPKMVVHVPGTYMKERQVTFGFQRPPLGWDGVVDEVRKKFYSIREGKEGVSEILKAWVAAAEEVLDE